MEHDPLQIERRREAMRLVARAFDLLESQRLDFLRSRASCPEVFELAAATVRREVTAKPVLPAELLTLGYVADPDTPLLGAGGSCETFKARHPRLGLDVVVKVRSNRPQPLGETTRDRHRRQALMSAMFEQERRALLRLRHPNIARIVDAGLLRDGREFVVTECIEGRALSTAGMKWDDILTLFERLLRAVAFMHESGREIYHNDLHSGNVIVAVGSVDPQVIDFGLAVVDGHGPQSGIPGDRTDRPTGDAHRPAKGPAKDINDVGRLLREAFVRPEAVEFAAFEAHDLRVSPPATIARRLCHILARTGTDDPRVRYLSADDLATDLGQVQSGGFPRGYRASLSEQAVWIWERQRRLAAWAVVAIAILVVMAAAIFASWATEHAARRSAGALAADYRDFGRAMTLRIRLSDYLDSTDRKLSKDELDELVRIAPRLEHLLAAYPELHLQTAMIIAEALLENGAMAETRSIVPGMRKAFGLLIADDPLLAEDDDLRSRIDSIERAATASLVSQSPVSPTE